MRTSIAAAGLAGLAFPLLTACANPSHATEAGELRDRLADLPAVRSAELDYSEPVTLDSGKLAIQVRMAPTADASAVAEVVRAAYDAFEGTHHGEEGDLDVMIGDDVIHLRSFAPAARTDDVVAAAERAVAVLPSGTVRADINTQDVATEPHVHTLYGVTVELAGADGLLVALTDLAHRHGDVPDAGWTVRSADGWELSDGDGFPEQAQRERLGELRAGLPAGATIRLGDDDGATVHLPADTSPAAASAMAGRHLRLLGDLDQVFYLVEQGDDLVASLTLGDCFFDPGPVGARIERDHSQGCAQ